MLVQGLVAPDVDAFSTPLGDVPLDAVAIEKLLKLPQVSLNDAAHEPEHSLEVQLPFLQAVLDDFRVIPLLVGRATAEEVAEVIELFWDAPETLIVISSDLSHFHDYETATRIDTATSAAIGRLDRRIADRRTGVRFSRNSRLIAGGPPAGRRRADFGCPQFRRYGRLPGPGGRLWSVCR